MESAGVFMILYLMRLDQFRSIQHPMWIVLPDSGGNSCGGGKDVGMRM
jgi:hypothetical protein